MFDSALWRAIANRRMLICALARVRFRTAAVLCCIQLVPAWLRDEGVSLTASVSSRRYSTLYAGSSSGRRSLERYSLPCSGVAEDGC